MEESILKKTHHLSRMAQLGECQETGLAQEIGISEETAVEQGGLVGDPMWGLPAESQKGPADLGMWAS